MGRRVLEQLNLNLRKRTKTTTDVWLPSWVRDDFRKRLGLEEHFQFFEKMEIVKIHELAEGEAVKLGDATVKAFRMTQPGLASYLVQQSGKRVVLPLMRSKIGILEASLWSQMYWSLKLAGSNTTSKECK